MTQSNFAVNQREFTERWVNNLVDSMDTHLHEGTRKRLMEDCGRACARGGALSEARACRGDLDKLLAKMEGWLGKANVRKDGDTVRLVYRRCFCQLVKKGPARLSDTYCYCSCGWLKEMFETVVRKPVEVGIESSIKRGAKSCRFTIRL